MIFIYLKLLMTSRSDEDDHMYIYLEQLMTSMKQMMSRPNTIYQW